jgi:probable rRNA maturation factor
VIPSYRVQVEIEPALGCPIVPGAIKAMVRATLTHEAAAPGASVWVRLADDAELAELNAEYRGIEGPTDVLSFPTQADDGWVSAPDAPLELGDIVISWTRVVAQATEEGHPAADELALLVVHGCLHLLGYDHLDPSDKQQMWASQEAVLSALGITIKID